MLPVIPLPVPFGRVPRSHDQCLWKHAPIRCYVSRPHPALFLAAYVEYDANNGTRNRSHCTPVLARQGSSHLFLVGSTFNFYFSECCLACRTPRPYTPASSSLWWVSSKLAQSLFRAIIFFFLYFLFRPLPLPRRSTHRIRLGAVQSNLISCLLEAIRGRDQTFLIAEVRSPIPQCEFLDPLNSSGSCVHAPLPRFASLASEIAAL